MAYATLSDVKARTPRTIDATSKPSEAQVEGFLEEIAGVIDGLLAGHDYALPIEGPSALRALTNLNATGAWALTEQAAFNSPHAKEANIAWLAALKTLREGHLVLADAPKVSARSRARSHARVEPRASLEMEL